MGMYQVKKCPKCGNAYETNSYGAHPSKDNRTKYGSPLKQCSKCKNIFIDNEYREIAIDGVRKVDTQRISPQALVYTGISLLMAVIQFNAGRMVWGIVFLAIALYFSREIFTYKSRQLKIEKLTQESEKRMQDLQYAQLLKGYGYNVPEKFLKNNSESFDEKTPDKKQQEQTSAPTDNLMTSQLAALYLVENKNAYKEMYIKRLLKLDINEKDIEKLFEFECGVIKTFNKKYLLDPQFTQMWFFGLDKPFFQQYPNKKDEILKECFLTISEICKIIDEAEWHYWNSHERELSDAVWNEIFEWHLNGAGGEFAFQYFDMIEEKIGVSSESLMKLVSDQGSHLSKYKW